MNTLISYALAAKTLAINIALLGFGLETPVGAGENHSKTLREDFVVLGWDAFTLEYGSWRVAAARLGRNAA
ncbi:MAG: hypothetical protein ACI9OO_000773 [Bacteroidia bacterium]|jgi:hypothetical protein